MTTNEQNKAVVRRFYEAFTADDRSGLNEVLAPDLVAYTHGSPDPQNREVHLQEISMWNAAIETQFTIEEQIAEGDKVVTWTRMRASHDRGEFFGLPPSGREAVAEGISLEYIKGDKIVARRAFADWQSVMQQLGLAPQPQADSQGQG